MRIIASPASAPFCRRRATFIACGFWKRKASGRRSLTGRRKKARAARQATPSPASPGPEGLRRALLGLITALIVARPLVPGEDPGLLAPLTSTTNLVLTLLWLVAVLGWAAWRAWSADGSWNASVVELG